jgi:hypothetical protein
MSDERTYRDDEVAEIFETAAARGDTNLPARRSAEGLTLAELQAIGGEVGLAPERIAEAAAALDLRRDALRRSDFGMPVAVRRTVDLPRAPTDREWEMLVAELRETFNARGRVGSRGDVREWTNGNLHAYVEPTPTGHRLRLGTTKGDATGLNRMGAAALVMAILWMVLFLAGGISEALVVPLMLALMGGGALTYNAMRLPSWAGEREAQMEHIAARARVLLGGEAPPEEPAGGDLRLSGAS